MTHIELYDSFLNEFPLEKLQTMKLEQYTNLDKKDSFCYWLEVLTSDLGSIWGGSSYKFGIYKYNAIPKRKNANDSSYKYDDEYAWLAKHGEERGIAFDKIKTMIYQIAYSANEGNFSAIDYIDLGDTYKWKIAFLYSNKNLISVFNPFMLRIAATEKGLKDAKIKTVSEVQRYLLGIKGDADIFEYSNELWHIASEIVNKSRNTWVYAPGDGACFWDDFYNEGVMAVGWDDLEDLSQYKNQSEINKKLQTLYGTDKSKSNDAKTCYDFCNNIKIGDTIIVKKGLYEILGYGTVASDYSYDNSQEEFCHRRDISWQQRGTWMSPNPLPQKTLTKKDEKFRETIMDIITSTPRQYADEVIENILLNKKQIILQGAPGTGKTFKTAELAVAICDGKFTDFGNRSAVMNRYNELKTEGRITFTTFHQSMDYEEFVEGLKPVSTSNGVIFEPKAGLFKEICDSALLANITLTQNIYQKVEFEDAFDYLLEQITASDTFTLPTKTNQDITLTRTLNNNIQFRHNGATKKYTVSRDRLLRVYNKYNNSDLVNNISNISKAMREIIGGCNASGYWAVLKYIVDHKNVTEDDVTDIENLSEKDKESAIQTYINSSKEDRRSIKGQNYVLIIDEINRGNISKILGELITLLEADKRIGEQNELTAQLPYSQKEFGIPSNLYIIGTMNTADRSIGYIDYAIRRRFGFVSIKSDFNVIADQLSDVVKPIADMLYKSVEKLMEQVSPEFNAEDLMIGHSYFIAKDVSELEMKLEYEIKPLLREYANDGILNLQKDSKTKKYTSIEELSINNQQPSDAK